MKSIIIKTSLGEMDFNFLCNKEMKRINNILSMIESEFNVDMNNHPELRKYILDTGNFIKRLPQSISAMAGDNK